MSPSHRRTATLGHKLLWSPPSLPQYLPIPVPVPIQIDLGGRRQQQARKAPEAMEGEICLQVVVVRPTDRDPAALHLIS